MDDAKERERCARVASELWTGNPVDQELINKRNAEVIARERADAFEAGRKAGREEAARETALKTIIEATSRLVPPHIENDIDNTCFHADVDCGACSCCMDDE